MVAQLDGDTRYDMLLMLAGGNDVLRLRSAAHMHSDLAQLAQRLAAAAGP